MSLHAPVLPGDGSDYQKTLRMPVWEPASKHQREEEGEEEKAALWEERPERLSTPVLEGIPGLRAASDHPASTHWPFF